MKYTISFDNQQFLEFINPGDKIRTSPPPSPPPPMLALKSGCSSLIFLPHVEPYLGLLIML